MGWGKKKKEKLAKSTMIRSDTAAGAAPRGGSAAVHQSKKSERRERKNPPKLSVQFKKEIRDDGVARESLAEIAEEDLESIVRGRFFYRPWDAALQEAVYAQWRGACGLRFYVPRGAHECTPGVCERMLVDFRAFEELRADTSTPPAVDVCFGAGACPCGGAAGWHRGEPVRGTSGFSVCVLSGKPHFCGEACEHLRRPRSSGGGEHLVCPVTGLEERDAPAVHAFWRPEGGDRPAHPGAEGQAGGFVDYAMSNASEMNHGVEGYAGAVAALFPNVARVPRPNSMEWKAPACARTNKERYLKVAIEKFSARLSHRHWLAEAQEAARLEGRASDMVSKYAAKCERSGLPLVAAHVREIVRSVRGRRAAYSAPLGLSNAEKSRTIVGYAQMAVRFWAVIRERTRAGREHPERMPFFHFVDAFTDFLCSGLLVSNAVGEKEVVVAKDPLLTSLPFAPDERDKKDQKKGAEVKKWVADAVEESVRTGVDPYRLSVDSMMFDEVEAAALEPLKVPHQWNRRRKGERTHLAVIPPPAATYKQKLLSIMPEYGVT